MNATDPFQFLSDLLGAARDRLGAPKLPDWLDHEIRNRLVLTLNHVLQQRPQAQQRLAAHQDKVLHAQWQQLALHLQITPAGLLALADESRRAHLSLQVEDSSALQLARHAMEGQRPQVRISGDAELATLVNWLADTVRWNAEADLARLIGAEAAQRVMTVLRAVQRALQDFVDTVVPASVRPGRSGDADATPPAASEHHPE